MKTLLTFFLLIPSICFSAQTAKQEKAETLLNLMHSESMVDATYQQMEGMMNQMAQQLKVQPEEEAIFEQYHHQLFALLKQKINWDNLKGPMVDIYTQHHTEQELDDMITFYQSTSGQAMVEKMPTVMQESMQISQSMVQEMLPEIKKLSQHLQSELQTFREQQDQQEFSEGE